MPEIVEADVRQTCSLQEWLKGTVAEVGGVEELTGCRALLENFERQEEQIRFETADSEAEQD